ncbi:MAG: MaoC family dehydratase N-terminal domain-containing protein [Aeromicrobium sp.]
MAVDVAQALALDLAPSSSQVERGRLRLFATTIGETDPQYSDLEAAKAQGHPDLPVPPTFLFGLEIEAPGSFAYLPELGIDMRWILHGEQSFTYHFMVHAGDHLTFRPRIVDVVLKQEGALVLLVKETEVTRADDVVATLGTTIVARIPLAAR